MCTWREGRDRDIHCQRLAYNECASTLSFSLHNIFFSFQRRLYAFAAVAIAIVFWALYFYYPFWAHIFICTFFQFFLCISFHLSSYHMFLCETLYFICMYSDWIHCTLTKWRWIKKKKAKIFAFIKNNSPARLNCCWCWWYYCNFVCI